ncbi:MAG: class I tRNA ligase family protein, partial [Planctomycetaceae bacterium]|nr:class I tRNA ligase family protein [Planctomycetaceae bacterium]
TRHDIGREALVQRIWNWKDQYQARIIQQLKGMGCSCDWSRTRFTLDEVCAKAVRYFFFKLFKQKWVYRGKRLVNWDTHLQTAVSDDEVFHETVEGHFWYIRYEIADGGNHPALSGTPPQEGNHSPPMEGQGWSVCIATTRPETLLGDTAVAVHPDPESALEKAIDELKKRIASSSEKEKIELQAELDAIELRKTDGTLARLKVLADMAKQGCHVILPLLNKKIPLIADEWAKPEKGTGCVKITPAHDANDYEVGKRQNLPMVNILNKDGTLNENAGQYAGLTITKAREKVVADLESAGLLVKTEDRVIELAHSDRSKTPIEPFLNDQWFVKMDELAQKAIDAVRHPRESGELDGKSLQKETEADSLDSRFRGNDDKVYIYPERYTKGYIDWLSEKRDWPIGRQLWWGHRIPIWYCPACKTADGRRQTAEERRENGASEDDLKRIFAGRDDIAWQLDEENNVWWICSQTEDLPAEISAAVCRLPSAVFPLTQEDDVLDTWFSSALWPHSTLGWPENTPDLQRYYPTGVLITSRDILTLWVARMVLAGLFNTGQKPFHEVYITPKILDKYGETMSKSKGNGIDPLTVINKFGADALRFAIAHLTTDSQDIRLILDFECPHCGALVEQTKKNRTLPRIPCPKCKKEFRTQWAEKPEDKVLPEGAMTGERFEVARNFCNKLWNAARFVLMNLETADGRRQTAAEDKSRNGAQRNDEVVLLEDQWILSRLATVTKEVTESLESYHYADAMRQLYDFAWDDFCSFYVEIMKSRLLDESQRQQAQTMLVNVLSVLVRLLHPVIPFVTEEIWQRLNSAAVCRLPSAVSESITVAPFPVADERDIKPEIEQQFAVFQELLRAVRDVRASRNVPPKMEIAFSVRCDEATAELLKPMEPYFLSMARARATGWGPATQSPALASVVPLTGMDVFVDISELIDIPAEIAKQEKEIAKLEGFIQSKESKLASDFVQKAPAAVVEKERQSLDELKEQLQTAQAAIQQLQKHRPN